jgi:TonB family protein
VNEIENEHRRFRAGALTRRLFRFYTQSIRTGEFDRGFEAENSNACCSGLSLARQAMNVSGKVEMEAAVAADGRVVSVKVIGGSPLLVNSALDALKKWRFQPASKDSAETVEFELNNQMN